MLTIAKLSPILDFASLQHDSGLLPTCILTSQVKLLLEILEGIELLSSDFFYQKCKYIKHTRHVRNLSMADSTKQFPFDFHLGSMDNTVRLWDAVKAFEDVETDDFTTATGHINLPENSQELLLGTYMTKSTPVVHLHFTRRNLVLAAGA